MPWQFPVTFQNVEAQELQLGPQNQAGIPPGYFLPSHASLSVLFLHPGAKGSAGAASPLIFRGAVLNLGRKGKGVGVS